MAYQSRILVVSRNPMLLQMRRLILGTYFDVQSAGRISEAGSILSRQDFDLIILCDTLSNSECDQIAAMVRDQKPMPALLSLLGPGTQGLCRTTGRSVELDGGPLQLLKKCAEVLGVDLRNNHRPFSA